MSRVGRSDGRNRTTACGGRRCLGGGHTRRPFQRGCTYVPYSQERVEGAQVVPLFFFDRGKWKKKRGGYNSLPLRPPRGQDQGKGGQSAASSSSHSRSVQQEDQSERKGAAAEIGTK